MSAGKADVLPNFTVAPHFFNLLHNRIYIIALLAVHVLAGSCCPIAQSVAAVAASVAKLVAKLVACSVLSPYRSAFRLLMEIQ
jgi:hypothetical protein